MSSEHQESLLWRARWPRFRFAALLAVAASLGAGAAVDQAAAERSDVTLVVQALASGDAFTNWITELNAEFEAAHPGVKISLQRKGFTDLIRTLKLQLSGDVVPDVTQVNQGYASMGALVKAGLLTDLSQYAEEYDWKQRQSEQQLAINGRFSEDGKRFGEGPLYGVSNTGTWVGLWMNLKVARELGINRTPATLAEVEQDMRIAKEKGLVPLEFGADSSDGQSILLLALLMQAQGSPSLVLDIVKGLPGVSLTSPPVVQAAATMQNWANEGYFTPDFIAYKGSDVWTKFVAGEGLFTINGSWLVPFPSTVDPSDFAMVPFPSVEENAKPIGIATGDLPWSVPANSTQKDLAAEYIDLLTSTSAADRWIAAGGVPVTSPSDLSEVLNSAALKGASRDAVLGWNRILTDGIPIPFMDWATPTFLNTLQAHAAELETNRITPEEYAQALQDDYSAFWAGQ